MPAERPVHRRAGKFAIVAIAVALCALSAPAMAVEISDPQWGFDGKARPHKFNLLTFTVDNPAPIAVEFDLELQKFSATPVDAPLVQHIVLSPGQRRTVHFYPYVSSDWTGWRLSWERQSMDVPRPRLSGRGARVLLDSSDVIGNSKGSVRRFPEDYFPPFVTGTDGLQAVVLDHAPRWEESRRQAFLDWLYLGGAVFVLHGPNGKYPEFPASMNMFNGPLETVHYGSGVIRKLPFPRNQLTQASARELWRQLPNVARPEIPLEPGLGPMQIGDDEEDDDEIQQSYGYSGGGDSLTGRSFLDELKQMTKPEHNWLLLHFMFWVYILLIFPGCFLVGQRRNDFRVVYLCLIGTVVVFSLAFGIVGQRGYGEATTVNSVAVVQPLPDGYLDVAEWSNVFVTRGATYDIRHAGIGTMYSSCQESERVNGLIHNGGDALFLVDIPPFSSREFASRMKVQAALPDVRVKTISAGESGLSELTLTIGSDFPATQDINVLYLDRFYSMARRGEEITLRSNVGAVEAFLRSRSEPGLRFAIRLHGGRADAGRALRRAVSPARHAVLERPHAGRRPSYPVEPEPGAADVLRRPAARIRRAESPAVEPARQSAVLRGSAVGRQPDGGIKRNSEEIAKCKISSSDGSRFGKYLPRRGFVS